MTGRPPDLAATHEKTGPDGKGRLRWWQRTAVSTRAPGPEGRAIQLRGGRIVGSPGRQRMNLPRSDLPWLAFTAFVHLSFGSRPIAPDPPAERQAGVHCSRRSPFIGQNSVECAGPNICSHASWQAARASRDPFRADLPPSAPKSDERPAGCGGPFSSAGRFSLDRVYWPFFFGHPTG
jgi:hypothetical protein